MGQRRRIALAALQAALCALSPACKDRSEPEPPPAPVEAPRPPVDKLEPGELAEGSEKAFGLPIPRAMRIEARFPDAVFATGTIAPELLLGSVQKRVVSEGVEAGPAKTVLPRATLKNAPTSIVHIEIVSRAGSTSLVVRDVTRPPAKDGLSEEQRWKELGLTPQGEPLDPTQLE
ncbi:MAG: hypothetical protein L6Q76_28205 [Polyangiaceae bacterium]|nr:hypothetical protein [Polyangiaceae bacterium]